MPVYRPAPCRSFWRSPVEFGARIVVKAGGKGLGTMAKAGNAMVRDRLQQLEGVQPVPCVIYRPNRASDDLRGVGTGRRAREAGNGLAAPRACKRAWNSVLVLFLATVACAATLGVACGAIWDRPESVSVEFGARIVVKAGGKGLGTMAKAGNAMVRDRLLRTAGLG